MVFVAYKPKEKLFSLSTRIKRRETGYHAAVLSRCIINVFVSLSQLLNQAEGIRKLTAIFPVVAAACINA